MIISAPKITVTVAAGGATGAAGAAGPPGAASGGSYVASETVSALRAVKLSSAGHVALAQPLDTTPVIAVTLTAAASGDTTTVVELGAMQDGSWSWALGSPVVLGANGTLTQDVSGLTRLTVIGMPMAADKLYVRIQPAVTLA